MSNLGCGASIKQMLEVSNDDIAVIEAVLAERAAAGVPLREAQRQAVAEARAQLAMERKTVVDAIAEQHPGVLDILKDVKSGALTPDEVQAAFPDAKPAKIEDIGEKIGGARKDAAVSTGAKGAKKDADERPTWMRRYRVSQITASMIGGDAGRWVVYDMRDVDRLGQPRQIGRETYATKEEADAIIPLAAVSRNHRVTTSSDKGADGEYRYEIWRDIGDRKRVKVVDKQFATRIEAMEYMAKNAREILETNTTFGEADLPKPESTGRVGVERRTGDVKGEDFQTSFGFRGVEFGNWNNQEERQEVMNEAYDGLMDLAEVLGVPPRAIGLNGDLALAFGARGKGLSGARAHYERDRAVMNLTKMNGAGALAHEWFHGLDHYLARQDGKASAEWKVNADGTRSLDTKGADEDMASGGFRRSGSGVRQELREAYTKLIQSLFYKAEQYVEDTAKADKFVAVTRGELEEKLKALRKDLAEQRDVRYYKRNNKPASAEQLAEFDALAADFVEGRGLATEWKTMPGNGASSRLRPSIQSRHTNDALEKMSAIYKAVRGRSGFDSTNHNGAMDVIRHSMTRYEQRLKMLADANSETTKTKQVPTSFAMDAKSLDQGRGTDYWTTPHEMAARAFQGYVEDMIAAKGGKSPFLNYAPENSGILTPWGAKRPYPSGDERRAMNAEFDAFVGAIQTKEDDAGNVAMFARGTKRTTGVHMDDAEAIIASTREALPTAPTIVPLESIAQAPADLRKFIREAGAQEDFEAAYHNGKIYILPANVGSTTRLQFLLAHHEIRHHGLASMLGPRKNAVMFAIHATNANVRAAAAEQIRRGYATSKVLATEEALADMPVADLVKLNGWDKIVAAVREWLRGAAARLRRAGLGNIADAIDAKDWTDKDVAALIARAEGVSRGGSARYATEGTVFGQNEDVATNKDVVGNNQGRRSAGGISTGASRKTLLTKFEFDEAVAFVAEVEALAEKHGAVFVRWSASEKHDLSEGARSRDAGSGEIHSGLSAQKIDADMHPATIARRIAEYGFSRGFSQKNAYPKIYIADEVGTDSDNAVSISNLKKVIDVPESFVRAIDKGFHDAYGYFDDVQRESRKLEKYPGHPAVVERLAAAKAKLEKLLPNESPAPDSGGASNAGQFGPGGGIRSPLREAMDRLAAQRAEKDAQKFTSITWSQAGVMGGREVIVATKDGNRAAFRVDGNGTIEPHTMTGSKEILAGKTLETLLGQDIAAQILSQHLGSMSGGDLGAGSQGAMFARGGMASAQTLSRETAARASNGIKEYRGMALGALGRRQIVDLYGKKLPQLVTYNGLMQQMDADKNEAGAGADSIADRWGKLNDGQQLSELMHEATLAQMDPDKKLVSGDDPLTHDRLRVLFDALSPQAQAIYRESRDSYRAHHEAVRSAIRERIERSEIRGQRKAELLKQMDDEFYQSIKGVYFPLARFGDYVVVVRDDTGKAINVSRAETINEAQTMQAVLRKAYPNATVGKVLKAKEFNAGRDAVGRGFMQNLYEVLGKKEMDENQRADLEDMLGQLYLSALPDLSWAKHGIHRKGTPGFSQDARRAFAQNMFHGARYLAKVRYSDLLENELTDMQKQVDTLADTEDFDSIKAQQVIDEMNKRHEAAMNPDGNALSTALTSLGFVFHLGLSPASALVNLTQTALVAYPIMGAKWGWTKASAALIKASQEAATNKNDIGAALSPDEKKAFDEAVRSGVIDVTMAHDLAGISQGDDAKVSWKLRPVMKWASFLFHHAEKFNRQVTFVAAYRLAMEAGAGPKSSYEQAVKATYDGHFDYASTNRPRFMQGNAAKVILLFKQYGQNMVYTLSRQAYLSMKGASPAERAQARKALGGLLTMHAAAAGVLGLPMVSTLLAAASMLGSDDDEPWDAEVALRNMLAESVGNQAADVLARGLSRLTPWDISGRVGLDKLILPDIQEGLEGQRLGESAMAAALGPVAGIGIALLKGLQEISDGNWARGLEAMAPSLVRGPAKAIRYANEGAIDKTGKPIVEDVNPFGIAGQALGFSPSDVRLATEAKSAVHQADARLAKRRAVLMRHYSMAVIAGDQDGANDAREDIKAFNEKNPQRRINPMQMAQSVRTRRKQIAESQGGVYLPKTRRDAMDAGRFGMAN